MTTVAYKDGILASDSSAWVKSTNHHGVQKLFLLPDGTLIGCAGVIKNFKPFIEWIAGGEDTKTHTRFKGVEAIVVRPDRSVVCFEDGDKNAVPVTTGYCAIGAGSDIALGAMFAGSSSIDAVKAALYHNAFTRGEIQVLHVNNPAPGVPNAPRRQVRKPSQTPRR